MGSLPHDGRCGNFFKPIVQHRDSVLRTGAVGKSGLNPAGAGDHRLLLVIPAEPKKILVVCTGNSCRSIMAEALINHLGQGRFQAWSAGSHPAGYVHPGSIATLKRHGINLGRPCSKSWNDLVSQPFDLILTVCDQAAGESCPVFPGQPEKRHWSIPDPARVRGTEDEMNAAFEQAFSLLKKRIEDLLS